MFRETAFVELLMQGGLTQREAACVERWIDDKRPGGKGPSHMVMAWQRAYEKALGESNAKICALLERIEKLEEALGVFGVTSPGWPD